MRLPKNHPQPMAKSNILVDSCPRAVRASGCQSPFGPQILSARSIMTCVVVPVIKVDGGALPRWTR